jgi:rhamnosyltransferase
MSASDATQPQATRRVCIYSFNDNLGVVDDYVVYFLNEISRHVERIIFHSRQPLNEASTAALQGNVHEIVIAPENGCDLLAYKSSLERIAFNADGEYDEVLLTNNACFGPIYPFAELFDSMQGRDCDFWGVTARMETAPDALTGMDCLPYHISMNFLAVRAKMLGSVTFRNYWASLPNMVGNGKVAEKLEADFTEYFTANGFKSDTYVDCRKFGTQYPALFDIDEMVAERNPLMERRAFLDDPRLLEQYAVDLPRALQLMARTSHYDPALIWNNVVRTGELRALNTNAALTSIFPDVRIKQAPQQNYGRIAVCAHVYYTDMVEELLALTDTIPGNYDFIATTDTPEKKQVIEDIVRGRENVQNVIVRIVEQNRGRDMSSLFITCRDLFLEDRYDLVCRLHTKKSPQVAAGIANMFKRHMFENLLHSPGYTTNVLDMFHDQPWIGVAVPPLVHIAFPTMGHVWFNNRDTAEQLKKTLDLKINFDPTTPVGAFGTMFWFRPKALRKLFAHPWQWTDFNAEPRHIDGGLAHVLERMICYVAQDEGYITQQILSSHLASRNFAMLEYKVEKLSAALPNADFTGQFYFLDHWRRLGYPASPTPDTMRDAFTNLLRSTRRSVEHRFPGISKMLRPLYRAFSAKNPNQDIQ